MAIKSGCKSKLNFDSIYFSILIISVVILSTLMSLATLIVSAYSKVHQTVHGKCEIIFLVGIFMIYLTLLMNLYSFNQPFLIFRVFAYFFTFLWANVLCFDIWWTFRDNIASSDDTKRFKFYCFYGFGSMPILYLILMIFANIERNFSVSLSEAIGIFNFSLFNLTVLADLFMLGSCGVKIFRKSRIVNHHDHIWFETQTERQEELFFRWSCDCNFLFNRFWSYIQIFLILLITWPIGYFGLFISYTFSIGSHMLSDFLKLFSAIVIFMVMAGKKFQIYNTLNN